MFVHVSDNGIYHWRQQDDIRLIQVGSLGMGITRDHCIGCASSPAPVFRLSFGRRKR
ncbi:MAG TPA: hypothetical protein VFV38_52025 [Ktedonobacteraceae bacterium]|nr:hypothetical protein [Ktedonobacteraceae bacterium]